MKSIRILATVLAALLAAFSSASTAAAAVTPRGEVFPATSARACGNLDADVAPLHGGGFVTVWNGNGTTPFTGAVAGRVMARIFDANGNPAGPEFPVSVEAGADQQTPAVATGPTGRFLVVWHDRARNAVMGRLFGRDGSPYTPVFHVTSGAAGFGPDVVSIPTGFAVAWAGFDQIFVRQYDHGGEASGPIATGGQTVPLAAELSEVSLAASPSGELAVAWSIEVTGFFPSSSGFSGLGSKSLPTDNAVRGVRIPAGALADPSRWVDFAIQPAVGLPVGGARIGVRDNGNMVVVWREGNDRATSLFGKILNPAGEVISPSLRLEEITWGRLGEPDLLLDPDGGFVVSWDGLDSLDDTGSIFVRSFAPDGLGLGPAARLAPGGPYGREGTALARLTNGDVIAVWYEGVIPDAVVTAPCVSAHIEARRLSPGCLPASDRLCLNEGRFQVETSWSTPGASSPGQAVPLTRDTGYFWFFDEDNVEVMVKVLDGRAVNGKYWVFYGSLSDVDWGLRVIDTVTGASKIYNNEPGQLASNGDTAALPGGGSPSADSLEIRAFDALEIAPGELSPVPPGEETVGPCADPNLGFGIRPGLCLRSLGFEVEVDWHDPFNGTYGKGLGVGLTEDSGYFWFFDHRNVELVVKVLDGRAVNGKYWVFYGALTNVEYTVTVRQLSTLNEKRYHNPPFQFLSRADTAAF